MASMPQTRYGHAAAAMGGKIYVSGGTTVEEERTSNVMVFDPQANMWTELASMGRARASHTFAAIGGKLYVFGGATDGGRTASVEAYDPISNAWAHVSELTSARVELVSVAL